MLKTGYLLGLKLQYGRIVCLLINTHKQTGGSLSPE